MTDVSVSRHGVPIRLADERWAHIVEEHSELAGLRQDVLDAIASCERVVAGNAGERLAVRKVEPGRALVVVYREVSDQDGFVITAFMTTRLTSLDRRVQVWPPQP